MEAKPKTPNIIQLMGKENKKQTKKTHQAITAAFRGHPPSKKGTPREGKNG